MDKARGGGRIRVLLVDALSQNPTSVADLLITSHMSFEVTECDSLQEALRLLEEEDFDIGIINPDLPDSDGERSLYALRSAKTGLPVVVLLSEATEEQLSKETLLSIAQDYIRLSELSVPVVLHAIRNAVDRKSFEDQLRRELDIDRAVTLISRALIGGKHPLSEIARMILSYTKLLTGSEHGFVSLTEEDDTERVEEVISGAMPEQCALSARTTSEQLADIDTDGAYRLLIEHSSAIGRSFFTNAPGDFLSSLGQKIGDSCIRNFLSVPAIARGVRVGQIVVANSNREYADDDVFTIERLADLYAMAVQQRRSDELVRQGLETFKSFMDHNPAVAYIKDSSGLYIYVNKTWKERFEFMIGDVIGKRDEDVWPEEFAKGFKVNDDRVLSDQKAIECIEAVPDVDGTHHWLTYKFPLMDASGISALLGGISLDITDQIRSDEKLGQKLHFESLLREVLSSALMVDTLETFLRKTLREIGESMEVSHVYLLELDDEYTSLSLTNEWVSQDAKSNARSFGEIRLSDEMKDSDMIRRSEVLKYDDIEEMPIEPMRQMFIDAGIRSALVSPIKVQSEPYGFLVIDTCRRARKWSLDDVSTISAISAIVSNVIERKLAEGALTIKEKAINSSLEAICFLDFDGTLLYVNRSFLKMLGLDSSEELRGEKIVDFLADESDGERVFDEIKERGSCSTELVVRRKDGTELTVLVSTVVIEDEYGNPSMVMASAVDITERKRAELELVENRDRISQLLRRTKRLIESAPMAIAQLDNEFRILLHNDLFARYAHNLSGLDESVGRSVFECFSTKEPVLHNLLCRAREAQEVVRERLIRLGLEMTRADRAEPVFDIIVSPLYDEDGGASGLLLMLQDISELDALERQREAFLCILSVVASSGDLRAIYDETLRVLVDSFQAGAALLFVSEGLLGNSHLASYYGVSLSKIEGMRGRKDIQPYELLDIEEERSPHGGSEDGLIVGDMISRFMTDNGFASVVWSPLLIEANPIGMIFLFSERENAFGERDFSALKTLADTLAGAVYRHSLRKEVSKARGEAATYLDLLCHDIANYCTPIQAYADLIVSDPSTPEHERQYAAHIKSLVSSISKLISRLRRITEIDQQEASEIRERDLAHVLSESVDHTLSAEHRKKVFFNFRPELSSVSVLADQRIVEVFDNLFDNAIRYAPSETIEIDVEFEEFSERGENYWKIAVIDSGVGIPDDMKHKVFRRFEGYWELKRGFGIGLFISRLILERSGGRIWLEDRVPGDPSKGAKIVVMLPRAGEPN